MSNKLGLCLMICFLLFVPALPARMQDGDCGFYDMGCEPAGDNCGLFGCEPAENCGLFGCEPPEGENCGLFGCGSGSGDDMFGSMEAMNCQSFETILGSFSMLGPSIG